MFLSLVTLWKKRREKYQAAADIVIETDGKDKLEICENLYTDFVHLTHRVNSK